MNDKKYDEFPRLSRTELLILEMLISKGELYGLEMVHESNGALKRGSVYVILKRLGDRGFVESRAEPRDYPEIGIPRRKYRANGLGERAYQANIRALEFLNSGLAWGGVN